MENSSQSSLSFWKSFLVLPVVVILILCAIVGGFASTLLWPTNDDKISKAKHQVVLAKYDPNAKVSALTPEQKEGMGDTSDAANDPAANYKAVLGLLKKNYYGTAINEKKSKQLTYSAIRGMLGSLRDQFTSFLDPEEWSQMLIQTRGDFEGIGALLQKDGVDIKVARPIEGSPAEKIGIKADDIIVSVDNKSVKGKELNDVVKLIKGKSGTKVEIGVIRARTSLTFPIIRARVEPPIVQHWMEDDKNKIGHIVLSEFNEKSIPQMEVAYQDLVHRGMKALVFDLRYNPGGLLEVAINVASEFIPADENKELKNVVVYIREGSGREQARLLQPSEYTHKPIPMVVLVNEHSASASEIVSGAIKDYGIGTLIGDRTFGKGKVQTLFPLEDNSALRLTTALYFPPKKNDINFKHDEDGNRIEGTGGITPDIYVKQSPKWKMEDFKDKVNDTQLQKALDFLRAKLNGLTTAQATDLVKKSP